jgi:GNAT superfamily N-acetyltransferase
LPLPVIETTWSRLLDPSEPVHGLVADNGMQLVGLAHVVFHRNLLQVRDTCYLQDLFTIPEMRGRGVAQSLIQAVSELCVAREVTDIYWHTHDSNAAARRLYDRIALDTGFVVYRKPLTQG